ncbi:MAG: tetratricopeptide repeat protein [Candidatus Brocadia sp.]
MVHFIGRAKELDHLNEFCWNNQYKLLLVAGESGIGKTSTVTEFAKRAHASHWIFLFRPEPHESSYSYLHQWLRHIQTGKGFFGGCEAWTRIVQKEPKISDFIKLSLSRIKIPIQDRFTELLERLSSLKSSNEKLILIIDAERDFIDANVLHTFRHIVNKIPTRVKIILTQRSNGIFVRDKDLIASDGVSTLFLQGFSESECREKLIASNLFRESNAGLMEKLVNKSKGNPLFLESSVRLLESLTKDGETIESAIDKLPDGLHDLMIKLYENIRDNDDLEIVHWCSIVSDWTNHCMISFLTTLPVNKIAQSLKKKELRMVMNTVHDAVEGIAHPAASSQGESSRDSVKILHQEFSDAVIEKLVEQGDDLCDRYKQLSAYYLQNLLDDKHNFDALRLYHSYLHRSGNKDAYLHASTELIDRFYSFGFVECCTEIIERAIAYSKESGRDKREYVEFMRKGGIICHKQGYNDKAIDFFNQALSIHREMKNKKGEASILGNIGIIFRDTFETDKAIQYLQESLGIYINMGDRAGESHILSQLWQIYYHMDDVDNAIEHLLKLTTITKELGLTEKMPTLLGNIGNLYCGAGDFDKAAYYYEQALDVSRKLGNRHKEAINLSRIGITYISKGLQIESLEYFSNALKLYIENGDKHGEAVQYGNIGIVYKNMGELDKALDYFERALDLFTQGSSRMHTTLIKQNIATVKKMKDEKDTQL